MALSGFIPNQGISWAGTADEDAAYRTQNISYGFGRRTDQGFNLSQWFADQGIDGDHSYYRYAQIRGLTQDQFQAGAGGDNLLTRGLAFGQGTMENLYSYGGTSGADTNTVAAQNITTLTAKGLDTWGRPLPDGFKTPEQAAAKRLAGVTGGMTGGTGGSGILSSGASIGAELALAQDETLGNK